MLTSPCAQLAGRTVSQMRYASVWTAAGVSRATSTAAVVVSSETPGSLADSALSVTRDAAARSPTRSLPSTLARTDGQVTLTVAAPSLQIAASASAQMR